MDDVTDTKWQAVTSSFGGLADALVGGDVSEDDVAATFAQAATIDVDLNVVLNSLHVPTDAGAHAEALAGIMRKIPDGWGRWIGHGPGWYDLIVAVDCALSAIDPEHEVHQVKEKYGTLRYYAEMSSVVLPCCVTFEAENPYPAGDDIEWCALSAAHDASVEHQTIAGPILEKRASDRARFDQVIDRAEDISARIDEQTGMPGVTMAHHGWYSTRDPRQAKPGERRPDRFVRDDGTYDAAAALGYVADNNDISWNIKHAAGDAAKLTAIALHLADELDHVQAVLAALHIAYAERTAGATPDGHGPQS